MPLCYRAVATIVYTAFGIPCYARVLCFALICAHRTNDGPATTTGTTAVAAANFYAESNGDVEKRKSLPFPRRGTLCAARTLRLPHTHIHWERDSERTNERTQRLSECRANVVHKQLAAQRGPHHQSTHFLWCVSRLPCIQFTCSLRYTFLFAWE